MQRQMARQQLTAFLLHHGRVYSGIKGWSRAHHRWLSDQKFERPAQQAVFQDYVNAVLDGEDRIKRIELQIRERIPSWSMGPVVTALSTLRGVSERWRKL
jgi:transposase